MTKIIDASTGQFVSVPGTAFKVIDQDTGEFVTISPSSGGSGTAPPPNITPNYGSFIQTGGSVIWTGGLSFRISAATYYINSTEYTSDEQTITLDAADGGNDRIDVIALGTDGLVAKITGTPAANPSKPDIDPETQLDLTFVLIPAGSATPANISTNDLYLENAGQPTEWDATSSGATINVNSTNNPRTDSKCIELTNADNNNWFMLEVTTPISLADKDNLVLYIRNKAAWPRQKSIRLVFQLNDVVVGSYVTLDDGVFGFDDSLTGEYQQVVIPISTFAVSASETVNQLLVTIRGSSSSIGGYIDDISFQSGTTQQITGMTQEQADARYVQINSNIHQFIFTVEGEVATSTGAIRVPNRFGKALVISAVYLDIDTAPTGQALIVDIHKDGTTIFTNQTHRPQIAAAAESGNTTTIDVISWAVGSYLTMDVDQVGSGTAGSNLTVTVVAA